MLLSLKTNSPLLSVSLSVCLSVCHIHEHQCNRVMSFVDATLPRAADSNFT